MKTVTREQAGYQCEFCGMTFFGDETHAEWPPRGAMAIKPGAIGCKLGCTGECTKFEEVKQ